MSEEEKYAKKLEIAQILENSKANLKEIEKEHLKAQAKNYAGAALQIGSAAIPGIAGGKIAGGAIKMSRPLIEQLRNKMLAKGITEGAVSGAVEGLGRGLLEDKNPIKTSIQDSVTGSFGGAALGGIAGKILSKNPEIKNLDELLDKRKDWGIAHPKLSGKPKEAIEKLLERKKGFVPNATYKEGIENIDFVWGKQDYNTGKGYGLEHIIDGRTRKNKIDGVEFVKSLPETYQKGLVSKGDKLHPERMYIEDPKNKISIEKSWNGKKRNWMLTAFKQNKADSKRLSSFVPGSDITPKEGSYSTSRLTSANNMIPNQNQNLNPQVATQAIQAPKSHQDWLDWLRKKRRR